MVTVFIHIFNDENPLNELITSCSTLLNEKNKCGKNVERIYKARQKTQKNQLTKKSNWLIYMSLVVGRARFERATIALKVRCKLRQTTVYYL